MSEPRSGRAVAVDWARRLLVAAVVVAAVVAVWRQWPDVRDTLAAIVWWQVGLSFAVLVVGVLLGMASWRSVLVGISHPGAGTRIGQIYLIGQMGKYVPGSVWAFLLQMEVGRKNGVARAQVFVTSLVTTGVSVAASLIVGAVAVPQLTDTHPWVRWLYLLLPVVLVALHPRVVTALVNLALRILRREPLAEPLRLRTIAVSMLWALAMYGAYGVHLWILIRSGGGIGFENALLGTSALALGMTAGLVAFLLPSGIGAREAVLVAALSTFLPAGTALAMTLLSRVMFTVAELACMGASYLHFRRAHGAPTGADLTRS